MNKHDKPELAMFTLLNPDFYGVSESHFTNIPDEENRTMGEESQIAADAKSDD